MLPLEDPEFELHFNFDDSLYNDTLYQLELSNFNTYRKKIGKDSFCIELSKEIEFGPTVRFKAEHDILKIVSGVRAIGAGARLVISVPETGYYNVQEFDPKITQWQDVILIDQLNFVKGKEIVIYLHNKKEGVIQFEDWNLITFGKKELASFENIQKIQIEMDSVVLSELDSLKNRALAQNYISKKEKIQNLQIEVKKRSALEDNFNQEIDELSQDAENLVSEIEKWQM